MHKSHYTLKGISDVDHNTNNEDHDLSSVYM